MGEREGKGKEVVEGLTLGKAGTTSGPPPQCGRNRILHLTTDVPGGVSIPLCLKT